MGFFNVYRIFNFPVSESTNQLAMQRLKTGEAKHGDIFQTDFQTSGKGQGNNTWYSSKGKNLLMTVVCADIEIHISKLQTLNILVSLAVFGVINRYFPERTKIKWPNDILIDEQKIAGILIETSLSGEWIKTMVIGIGINVNESDFPQNLPHACSFKSLTGKEFNPNDLLLLVQESLNQHLSKLNLDFVTLQKEYTAVLFGLNRKRYFRRAGQSFEGTIKGISANGQLCVETIEGLNTFSHKEITFDFDNH